MTKDEIIDQMIDEMPFNLSENVRPYVKEAMDIYAQQEVINCNILAVMQRSEQLISLLEKLFENNMCSHAGDELIEQMLKEINCA